MDGDRMYRVQLPLVDEHIFGHNDKTLQVLTALYSSRKSAVFLCILILAFIIEVVKP
jgi:hypothetical protein